jgi:fatty acid-binding protein DegV
MTSRLYSALIIYAINSLCAVVTLSPSVSSSCHNYQVTNFFDVVHMHISSKLSFQLQYLYILAIDMVEKYNFHLL